MSDDLRMHDIAKETLDRDREILKERYEKLAEEKEADGTPPSSDAKAKTEDGQTEEQNHAPESEAEVPDEKQALPDEGLGEEDHDDRASEGMPQDPADDTPENNKENKKRDDRNGGENRSDIAAYKEHRRAENDDARTTNGQEKGISKSVGMEDGILEGQTGRPADDTTYKQGAATDHEEGSPYSTEDKSVYREIAGRTRQPQETNEGKNQRSARGIEDGTPEISRDASAGYEVPGYQMHLPGKNKTKNNEAGTDKDAQADEMPGGVREIGERRQNQQPKGRRQAPGVKASSQPGESVVERDPPHRGYIPGNSVPVKKNTTTMRAGGRKADAAEHYRFASTGNNQMGSENGHDASGQYAGTPDQRGQRVRSDQDVYNDQLSRQSTRFDEQQKASEQRRTHRDTKAVVPKKQPIESTAGASTGKAGVIDTSKNQSGIVNPKKRGSEGAPQQGPDPLSSLKSGAGKAGAAVKKTANISKRTAGAAKQLASNAGEADEAVLSAGKKTAESARTKVRKVATKTRTKLKEKASRTRKASTRQPTIRNSKGSQRTAQKAKKRRERAKRTAKAVQKTVQATIKAVAMIIRAAVILLASPLTWIVMLITVIVVVVSSVIGGGLMDISLDGHGFVNGPMTTKTAGGMDIDETNTLEDGSVYISDDDGKATVVYSRQRDENGKLVDESSAYGGSELPTISGLELASMPTEEAIELVARMAAKAAAENGIKVISSMLGQTLFEGGRYQSDVTKNANNCLGIIAGSWEREGKPIYIMPGGWRHWCKFESINECIDYYFSHVIQQDRYASAREQDDPIEYLKEVLRGGYGDSPDEAFVSSYSGNIESLMAEFDLTQYDDLIGSGTGYFTPLSQTVAVSARERIKKFCNYIRSGKVPKGDMGIGLDRFKDNPDYQPKHVRLNGSDISYRGPVEDFTTDVVITGEVTQEIPDPDNPDETITQTIYVRKTVTKRAGDGKIEAREKYTDLMDQAESYQNDVLHQYGESEFQRMVVGLVADSTFDEVETEQDIGPYYSSVREIVDASILSMGGYDVDYYTGPTGNLITWDTEYGEASGYDVELGAMITLPINNNADVVRASLSPALAGSLEGDFDEYYSMQKEEFDTYFRLNLEPDRSASDYVQWMIDVAEDPNVGYDQSGRNTLFTSGYYEGNSVPCEVDCSSFTYYALCISGAIDENPAAWPWASGAFPSGLARNGFTQVGTTTGALAGAQAGDILVCPGHHVMVCTGPGEVVEASSGENGITGNTAGDSTGKEVWVHQKHDSRVFQIWRK